MFSININNKSITLYLLMLNILVYLNYRLFLLAFMIFIFLSVNNNLSFNKNESVLLKLIPLNYYFDAIYGTFNENRYSSFFGTCKTLHYLRCNTSSLYTIIDSWMRKLVAQIQLDMGSLQNIFNFF